MGICIVSLRGLAEDIGVRRKRSLDPVDIPSIFWSYKSNKRIKLKKPNTLA